MVPPLLSRGNAPSHKFVSSGDKVPSSNSAPSQPDSGDSSLPLETLRELVTVERGTLPIILSVPHGGTLPIPHDTERQGRGFSDFQTVRDAWTAELAAACIMELERQLRGKPWLILARFDRKFLDVNRPAERAYESRSAKAVYEYYHRSVAAACTADCFWTSTAKANTRKPSAAALSMAGLCDGSSTATVGLP